MLKRALLSRRSEKLDHLAVGFVVLSTHTILLMNVKLDMFVDKGSVAASLLPHDLAETHTTVVENPPN